MTVFLSYLILCFCAAALLQRLAHVYLGPDVRFPPMDDPPAGYVMRTTPTRVGGVGPWAS